MTGLAGTRVIIVDDNASEALPVLKAFALEGIPTAFFHVDPGGEQNLPLEDSLLTGVRLAILDMVLVEGQTQDSDIIGTLINYLEKILSPDNGPYTIIAWTHRPELLSEFEATVFKTEEMPKPIFSLMLTKAECKDSNNNFDFSVISQKLRDKLGEFSPLFFLQHWEEKCFLAATEVSNGISKLVKSQSPNYIEYHKQWRDELLQLLHAMARAQVGKQLDLDNCVTALYDVLGPLYADRMESLAANLPISIVEKSKEIIEAPEDCTIDKKASINSMLHLSLEGLRHFTGGNLYIFPEGIPTWIPDNTEFFEDCSQPEKAIDVEKNCIPIIIEISANCDHAQDNIRLARFLLGLMIPEKGRSNIKKAEFIWELGPLYLPEMLYSSVIDELLIEEYELYGGPYLSPFFSNGTQHKMLQNNNYYIYFSARHFVSLDRSKAEDMNPFARLRHQAFTDLQAWFARHASRPGKVLLEEFKKKKK